MQLLDLTSIQAVLFDMDGTMIDNMYLHKHAWQEFTKRRGIEITDEEFKVKFPGTKSRHLMQMIFGQQTSEKDIEKLTNEIEELYRTMAAKEIEPIPGLLELINRLKQKRIKLAVATSAPKGNRDLVLKTLGLQHTFDVIVGEEDIQHGKPDPEIFLKAAQALHVSPTHCLVFEDAPFGVEAAKKAGMKVLALLTSHTQDELNDADMLIRNFEELEIE